MNTAEAPVQVDALLNGNVDGKSNGSNDVVIGSDAGTYGTNASAPSTPSTVVEGVDIVYHPIRSSQVDTDHDHANSRPSTSFVLGTRKSNLALVQTHLVANTLSGLHPSCEFSVEWMTTVGDRNQQTPLHLLTPYSQQQPAKSLWTDELEARLMSGGFDLLVHSLKDVPTTLKEGCEIGCMLEREDPRDAFVVKEGLSYKTLGDLPDGSIVGTGSVRRVAQLKRAYPKLKFEDMRGNLNTRLSKLDKPESPFAGLILAISGLTRINCAHRVTSPISSPDLYHAVGQGALGVEIRSGDDRVREAMRGMGHWQTEWRCGAERGCLRVLEGGCSVPVGVETTLEELEADDHSSNTQDEVFASERFPDITDASPMLWFSGIVYPHLPLPVSRPPSPTPSSSASASGSSQVASKSTLPPLRPRRARLTLRACVTSLDGSQQVVHTPPPVIVRNYQEAERFGELCAQFVKTSGGKDILDEVSRIRRERERRDLERALEKSMRDAEAGGDGSMTPGLEDHVGLKQLMRSLMGENETRPGMGAGAGAGAPSASGATGAPGASS